jgi:hypothetical protein
MSRRANSKRKQDRKDRNRVRREVLLASLGEADARWQPGDRVRIRVGRHPCAVWEFQLAPVAIPVDVADPNHMAGVEELTRLARDAGRERN